MTPLRLVLDLPTAEAVAAEWRAHLSAGGAYVKGVTAARDAACTLVLRGPGGRELELAGRVVYAAPDGVGIELTRFGDHRARVEAWIEEVRTADVDLDPPTTRAQPSMPMVRFGAAPEPLDGATIREPTPIQPAEPDEPAGPDGPDEPDEPEPDEELDRDPAARNVFERLRGLSIAAQLKVARDSDVPSERMALERMYGKIVWEALLRNSRITHPEVARIARMGALPRPLLEMIVGNTAWLRSPEVRRALLSNKRLAVEMIQRVLRLLPKLELRLVPNQTAYSSQVREVARRMLKEAIP